MTTESIEEKHIRAFIVPNRRAGVVERLRSKRLRGKQLDGLNHFTYLDPRFCTQVPPTQQHAHEIEKLLRAKGAPVTCYLISSDRGLDGRELSLRDALEGVVASGSGTIVICIPGRLGYFEGEDPGDRFVLERRAG